MRDFDIVNEIVSELPEEVYKFTEKAANAFYMNGNRQLLRDASMVSGLTPDEILAWW